MILRGWGFGGLRVLLSGLALAAISCGEGRAGRDYGRWDGTGTRASGPALRVRWSKLLGQEWGGAYIPIERATAAIDPQRARVYVGSSRRDLWAFDGNGHAIYKYSADSSIEAEPTLDVQRDELYVTSASGRVHALHASDGTLRFTTDVGATISQPGVLSDDALFLVTDADGVYAISRKDGSVLWKYQRDPRAGLKVTGHAGLLVSGQRLITGFSDGAIVSLAQSDGRAVWVVDTTLDFADPAQGELGFVDVDTTPVQIGDTVYVASFLAGFYALRVQDGVAQYRHAELTGITSLSADEHTLVLASAERGVTCYDMPSFSVRWSHNEGMRGAPNYVRIRDRAVYVTESRGALLALALAEGREIGRIQTEHGFAGMPSLVDGQGAILSNSGVLYTFDY
jgi:outer membrane protein assembly factor BamB